MSPNRNQIDWKARAKWFESELWRVREQLDEALNLLRLPMGPSMDRRRRAFFARPEIARLLGESDA